MSAESSLFLCEKPTATKPCPCAYCIAPGSMPGNVQNAAVSVVLPESLSTAFERVAVWAVRENVYNDGFSQRAVRTTTSRKAWALSKRLTAAELTELRDFFEARRGIEAFYFYDGTATSPKWTYDESGVTSLGRHTVVFQETSWEQAIGIGARGEVSLTLLEAT